MPEFTLWGLAGSVAVAFIMEVLKKVLVDKDGEPIIKDRWAVVTALGVGLVLAVVAHFANLIPTMATIVDIIGAGILAGAAAGGGFSLFKPRPTD